MTSKPQGSASASKGSDAKSWAQYANGGVKKHDEKLRTTLLQLNLAAEAAGANHELRDKYLLEQEDAPGTQTSANPDLQAARSAARQAPRSAGKPIPGGPGRYSWKSTFSPARGKRMYSETTPPRMVQSVTPSAVTGTPVAEAAAEFEEPKLIDFD